MDGAGTTTQSKLLEKKLKSIGRKACWSKEPTDFESGKEIRSLLKQERQNLSHLFVKDRKAHIESLNLSEIHIFDRYYLSNMVYQIDEHDFSTCYELNKSFPVPDLTIFIDTPVKACLDRISKRESKDIFENKEFLTKARELYLSAISYLKLRTDQKIIIYNPEEKSEKVVSEEIMSIVNECFCFENIYVQSKYLMEIFKYSGANIVSGSCSWVTPNVPSDSKGSGNINLSDRTTQLICADILSDFEDDKNAFFINYINMRPKELCDIIKKRYCT